MQRDTFPVGPLQCNCSILFDESSKEAIVVDAGGDADVILAKLADKGAKLTGIITTHAHIDHLCAIPELVAATGVPIYLHDGDRFLYEQVAMQGRMLGIAPPRLPEFASLTDGSTVDIGAGEAGIIHTPGHTPGSVCFLLAEHKLLLTGDTLFRRGIGRTDLWGGSYEQIIASISDRLLRLEADTVVVPGHGPLTTVGEEQRHNPFLTVSS